MFPVFVRGGLLWEEAELGHLRSYLAAVARPELEALTILEEPVADVYGNHWSTTGQGVPDAASPDSAVFLPGRNLFLVSKAAVWCVLRGIPSLALGTLGANPFPDSTREFYHGLEGVLRQALGASVAILLPYATVTKAELLARARGLPLERTFSCIRPVQGLHCGACNKCAERRRGFAQAGIEDPTRYVEPPAERGTDDP